MTTNFAQAQAIVTATAYKQVKLVINPGTYINKHNNIPPIVVDHQVVITTNVVSGEIKTTPTHFIVSCEVTSYQVLGNCYVDHLLALVPTTGKFEDVTWSVALRGATRSEIFLPLDKLIVIANDSPIVGYLNASIFLTVDSGIYLNEKGFHLEIPAPLILLSSCCATEAVRTSDNFKLRLTLRNNCLSSNELAVNFAEFNAPSDKEPELGKWHINVTDDEGDNFKIPIQLQRN